MVAFAVEALAATTSSCLGQAVHGECRRYDEDSIPRPLGRGRQRPPATENHVGVMGTHCGTHEGGTNNATRTHLALCARVACRRYPKRDQFMPQGGARG